MLRPRDKRDFAGRDSCVRAWGVARYAPTDCGSRNRYKFIGTSLITSWQTKLEQGVYDAHFVFPSCGPISYDEIEWLELNAGELEENELEHFGKVMHNTRIMQCHVLPLTMQIWRLYGYYKIPDEGTMID